MQSMYCGMCSKHPSVASKASEVSKRSGTNNFKNEVLKKHEANQSHKKCLEAERAINNPKMTEMYKCCKHKYKCCIYEKDNEKIENQFKTAFHVAALERPFDDNESLCALQKLTGVELGKTFSTPSPCMDLLTTLVLL